MKPGAPQKVRAWLADKTEPQTGAAIAEGVELPFAYLRTHLNTMAGIGHLVRVGDAVGQHAMFLLGRPPKVVRYDSQDERQAQRLAKDAARKRAARARLGKKPRGPAKPKPVAKPRPLYLLRAGAPAPAPPPVRPESVEEFKARGGQVERVATDWTRVRPKFAGHRTYNDMSWRAATEAC